MKAYKKNSSYVSQKGHKANYRALSLEDKLTFLDRNFVYLSLKRWPDLYSVLYYLVDLPYDVRKRYFEEIECPEYFSEDSYCRFIKDLLLFENYEKIDFDKVEALKNGEVKYIPREILRKLSIQQLRQLIDSNYSNVLTGDAFLEYCKKCQVLEVDIDLVKNINTTILVTGLKKREKKGKKNIIKYSTFRYLPCDVQNFLMKSNNSQEIIDGVLNSSLKLNSNTNTEELIKGFKLLMENLNFTRILELQSIIYSINDESAKELMRMFFKRILGFEFEVEDRYLNAMIYQFRQLSKTTSTILELIKKDEFDIINYLNTGRFDNLRCKRYITADQFQKVNTKKLNKLKRTLSELCSKQNYNLSESIIEKFCYMMYFTIGYDNSFDLLTGRFGKVTVEQIVNIFDYMRIDNVKLERVGNSYEPVLNTEFIQFIFGSKKDNNSTIKRVIRSELDVIYNNFSGIYNDFSRIQQQVGKKVHLNTLIPILEANPLSILPNNNNLTFLLPNEYKLTRDIINYLIKSSRYNDIGKNRNGNVSEREIISQACSFYHQYVEKRILSSIPRVFGEDYNGYRYEILKLNDPMIMTLGYLTSSCFRIDGKSHDFLKFCSENEHARILVIRDKDDTFCAMVPIVRRGNVVVGNSIEASSKCNEREAYHTIKAAFKHIINESTLCEEKPIQACLVSNLHNNVFSKKSVSPKIFSVRFDFYTNYDNPLYVVESANGIEPQDYKTYIPDAIYYDERPEILCKVSDYYFHFGPKIIDPVGGLIDKRIRCIDYINNPDIKNPSYSEYSYKICGEDWYIMVGWRTIVGDFINKDPRAAQEYYAIRNYLEEIKDSYIQKEEFYKKYNTDPNIRSFIRSRFQGPIRENEKHE